MSAESGANTSIFCAHRTGFSDTSPPVTQQHLFEDVSGDPLFVTLRNLANQQIKIDSRGACNDTAYNWGRGGVREIKPVADRQRAYITNNIPGTCLRPSNVNGIYKSWDYRHPFINGGRFEKDDSFWIERDTSDPSDAYSLWRAWIEVIWKNNLFGWVLPH